MQQVKGRVKIFPVPITLFIWLPYLSVLMGTVGLSALAVAMWRTFRKPPPRVFDGLQLGSAGLLLLLAGLCGWGQYHSSSKGRYDSCKSILGKGIASALEMYAEDHNGELPGSLAELTPTYLKNVPICPAAGRDTYSKTYTTFRLERSGELGYAIACSGYNHWGAGVTVSAYPVYNSYLGTLDGPYLYPLAH